MKKIFSKNINKMHKATTISDNSLSPYYLKISIPDYTKYLGKQIKVFCKNKLIWGIELEAPAKNQPLEYRNIVVLNNGLGDFRVEPDFIKVNFELSDTRFITKEQVDYDQKYKLEENSGLFFTQKGNKKNPKKIILTFPGFGPSTSRISYALTALSSFDTKILEDTLILAFQDRYLTSGSYMIQDDNGSELYPKFNKLIEMFLKRYSLKESDLMFFGASKGGSIALMYAKNYPKSKLVVSVPQVNLLYYWQSKSFFRNNLFHFFKGKKGLNLIELLNLYYQEEREIHYFYTDDDELSNYSHIESKVGVNKLYKYRVDGTHGEVTKKIMPTIEYLVTSFVYGQKSKSSEIILTKEFISEANFQVQFYLNEFNNCFGVKHNKYLSYDVLGTKIFHYCENHPDMHKISYLNEAQKFVFSTNYIPAAFDVDVMVHSGKRYTGRLALTSELPKSTFTLENYSDETIITKDTSVKKYLVIEKDVYESVMYRYFPCEKKNKTNELQVIFRDNLEKDFKIVDINTLIINSNISKGVVNIFLSRVQKYLKLTSLKISIESNTDILYELIHLDFANIVIQVFNPKLTSKAYELTNDDLDKIKIMSKSGKLFFSDLTADSPQFFKIHNDLMKKLI